MARPKLTAEQMNDAARLKSLWQAQKIEGAMEMQLLHWGK